MPRLNKSHLYRSLAAALIATVLPFSAFARGMGAGAPGVLSETPKELEGIGIDEHLGSKVDLGLTFRDENGAVVPLSKYVNGSKPVILDLAYFSCPSLCNFHLNGLNDAFKQMKWTLGQQFDVVVVSIDAREKPALATAKKASYIKEYGRPEGAAGWHFLTGAEPQIQALAKQVGFKYRWDEKEQQFAHASAAYVLTPDGRISQYLYGIVFQPDTVRLSLVEAGDGKIGTIIDKLTLWCFHLDPSSGKYTIAATNVMRGGGIAVLLIIAGFLIPFWWRQRRSALTQGEA